MVAAGAAVQAALISGVDRGVLEVRALLAADPAWTDSLAPLEMRRSSPAQLPLRGGSEEKGR